MSSQRSLLRSIAMGTAGRRHRCKSNAKHVLAKGDPMLIMKIDRNEYHYCRECAVKFIRTARCRLDELESSVTPTAGGVPHAS